MPRSGVEGAAVRGLSMWRDPGTHLDKLLLIRMLRIYVGFRKGLGLIFVAENGL